MADARVTRLVRETLGEARESAQVTRQGLQVAVERPGANAAATAAVTRYGFEVLAQTPAEARVTRQGLQVAFERPGANSGATAAVTRHGLEVLGAAPATAAVTRQGLQIAVPRPTSGSGNARVTRVGFEVLGRRFITMSDFAVPANFELFFHNWAQSCELESTYVTDVAASAADEAEERVGLTQKPYRRLRLAFAVQGNTQANRALVEMRRLVDEVSAAPILCDAVQITADASATDTEVAGDFSRSRFFQNGPAIVFQLRPNVVQPDTTLESHYEVIDVSRASSSGLTFKTALVNDYDAANTFVVPLMQTHPQVVVEIRSETNNLLLMSVEFDEIYGPSAIPPVASDLPSGFDSYSGMPILSTDPQWISGLTSTIRRGGSQETLGRGRVVFQTGARGKRISGLEFLSYREIAWNLIRFFDSRRGRLMPFWVIDYDNLFTVTNITPSYVSVTPNGSLSDFQAESDYIGVIFSDGKAAVRKATAIQQVGGSWRVTLDSSLPSGYTAADVVSFDRARLCRMESDSLLERWTTTQVCALTIPVIELLAEQEVSIG